MSNKRAPFHAGKLPPPPETTDPTAGERCNNRRHLRPHATFGDDPSGHCGCAECDGCDCTPAESDAADVGARESLIRALTADEPQPLGPGMREGAGDIADIILASDWLDAVRRKAGDERAEEIAQEVDLLPTYYVQGAGGGWLHAVRTSEVHRIARESQ